MATDLSAARRRLRLTKADLAKQVADMRRLHEMGARLSSHVDLPTLLQDVLSDVCRLQNAAAGVLMLYDAEHHDLKPVASVGLGDDEVARFHNVAVGEGPCGTAVAERRPVIVHDSRTRTAAAGEGSTLWGGYQTVCCIPLQARTGQIVGTIATYFRKRRKPSPGEMDILALYGGQASEFIENARHYQQLRDASRIKDEFLATLSHEIRTPLNAVLGWTRVLRSGAVADEQRMTKALESIERNARVQAQLIEDLLDISRIVTGRMRVSLAPLDMGSVVLAAVDVVQPAAESKRITLAIDVAPDVVVFGDADRLQQVVWNILVNAVKFTPEQGTITVRLDAAAGAARLAVSDTGIGIPQAALPYVFDRFRQGESRSAGAREGLGLGLAIVRHLVEAHGGSVEAASGGEGTGATFTITLPISAPSSALRPRRAQKTSTKPNALSGRRILIVDDEADARELIATTLQAYGAATTVVTSAADALKELDRAPFDAILADIGMPDMNGYALIRTVRARPADKGGRIPAVALTVFASSRERDDALAAGYEEHLAKPVDPDRVVDLLDSLVSRSSPGRTPRPPADRPQG